MNNKERWNGPKGIPTYNCSIHFTINEWAVGVSLNLNKLRGCCIFPYDGFCVSVSIYLWWRVCASGMCGCVCTHKTRSNQRETHRVWRSSFLLLCFWSVSLFSVGSAVAAYQWIWLGQWSSSFSSFLFGSVPSLVLKVWVLSPLSPFFHFPIMVPGFLDLSTIFSSGDSRNEPVFAFGVVLAYNGF